MVRLLSVMSCWMLLTLLFVTSSSGYPSVSSSYRDEGQYEPEDIVDMLTRLHNIIDMERKMEQYNEDLMSSDKRGLDLGLNRGYSGALQAKHLMGIAAANFAGGPGRKRRSSDKD